MDGLVHEPVDAPERDYLEVLLGWADELDRSEAIHQDGRHGKLPAKLRFVADELGRLRTEVENRQAELEGCQAFVVELTGLLSDRCRELDRLREAARRAYHADGTFELLDSPEEVVRVRIETAGELARLHGLLKRIGELVREAGP